MKCKGDGRLDRTVIDIPKVRGPSVVPHVVGKKKARCVGMNQSAFVNGLNSDVGA
jgi:hypothetical protein